MTWVDAVLKDSGMILNAYIPVFSYLLGHLFRMCDNILYYPKNQYHFI